MSTASGVASIKSVLLQLSAKARRFTGWRVALDTRSYEFESQRGHADQFVTSFDKILADWDPGQPSLSFLRGQRIGITLAASKSLWLQEHRLASLAAGRWV
jgi:hypothetical protein